MTLIQIHILHMKNYKYKLLFFYENEMVKYTSRVFHYLTPDEISYK